MSDELELEGDLNDDLLEDENLENDDNVDLNDNEGEDDNEGSKGQKFSPEQLAELAAQAALKVQGQSQQHKPLTPEEIDAQLHRYKVSPDIVKLLRDPEASPDDIVKSLQALVDGAAKHAVASSQLLFRHEMSPLQQQLQAQQEFVKEQQTNTFVKNVSSQYPALAKFEKVVREATKLVSQSGYQPKSHTDARRQVALQAQQIIRTVDPNFSLKSNPARQAGGFVPRRSSHGDRGAPQGRTGAASFADYLR